MRGLLVVAAVVIVVVAAVGLSSATNPERLMNQAPAGEECLQYAQATVGATLRGGLLLGVSGSIDKISVDQVDKPAFSLFPADLNPFTRSGKVYTFTSVQLDGNEEVVKDWKSAESPAEFGPGGIFDIAGKPVEAKSGVACLWKDGASIWTVRLMWADENGEIKELARQSHTYNVA